MTRRPRTTPRGRVRGRGTRLVAAVTAVAIAAGGCGADPSDAPGAGPTTTRAAATTAPIATSTMDRTGSTETGPSDTSANSTAGSSADSTTDPAAVTTTSEPRPEVPTGVLVAVPQQNREDPAKGQFQVQVINGTREQFAVSSVQFVWEGFSSPVTPRDSRVVGGQVIDFPVPFPGAVCVGDGSLAAMPAVETAVVRLGLGDGTVRDVPVVDKWHLARRLYLEDCERQRIAAEVTIEWADLRPGEHEGRPVTEGVLRLTRGTNTATVRIESVAGTIPYGVETPSAVAGEPVVVLSAGEPVAEAPIRFVENRCDPHALAETKQPHRFVVQVDLGDGELRPFVVEPAEADRTPMRRTADEACAVTGQLVPVGEED